MAIFKCKMCGGNLEVVDAKTIGTCESCGTTMTLPRLDDDRRVNLYDRANHFRRNNEFDKAAGIFEQILNEDRTDAEAHWSLVLCKYGIEYVEDPSTHRRVPTCNRTQFTSVFADEDYKQALAHADGYQKSLFEGEAKAIDDIQKGILEISSKEEPFDVFVCYKETDNNGRRTPDSVLAQELYFQLKHEGFKVFFSRITLEDKLGSAYEPYIFAALNSARVMVVVGTKPEYINAAWVKNEWNRYLALIKQGSKKTLIPAYKDMDPYDLPNEFSHLQAQDMGKLGFMQDLVRGIKKIATETAPPAPIAGTSGMQATGNSAPLLERAFLCLEDGDWKKADDLLEQVLNLDPKNSKAYIGKLMVELKIKDEKNLVKHDQPLDGSNNYKKALRFADESYQSTLSDYNQTVLDQIQIKQKEECERFEAKRKEDLYQEAKLLQSKGVGSYIKASEIFKSIAGYKDADILSEECEKAGREIEEKLQYLFNKYGITKENDHYVYKNYRYDNLQYAIDYAELDASRQRR